MAGDWTPLRDNIHDDPAVYTMAAALNVRDTDLIVGKVTRFWAWASQHSADGRLAGMTPAAIDGIAHQKGLAAALLACGWLVKDGDTLVIPRFDRWMSRSAKARLGETTRKQIQRAGRVRTDTTEEAGQKSGSVSGQKRDHSTVQNRREETQDPTPAVSPEPPSAPTAAPSASAAGRFLADREARTGNAPPGFARFWAEYPSGHATDRGGLLALWRALGLEDDSGAVLTGLAAWKGSERWREGYVVKARKFLEERHWEVPPPAPKAKPQALGGAW